MILSICVLSNLGSKKKCEGTEKTQRDIACLLRATLGPWGAGRGRTVVVWGSLAEQNPDSSRKTAASEPKISSHLTHAGDPGWPRREACACF